MELKHLRLIVAIETYGSLTLAGERLFLTQSALSHQLREFEVELGMKLYHRINRKLVPTPAGQILISKSRTLLINFDEMIAEVKSINTGQTGEIKLCLQAYSNYFWLPELLRSFNEIYPSIGVEITTSGTNAPLEKLLSGKIDFAIVVHNEPHPQIGYTELFEDQLVAIIPQGHDYEYRPFLTIEDILSQTLITHSENDEMNMVFEKIIEPKNFNPKRVIHIGSTEAIVKMVQSGLGVAIVSEWAISSYNRNKPVLIKKLNETGLFRYWYLASLKSAPKFEYSSTFVELLTRKLNSGVVSHKTLLL